MSVKGKKFTAAEKHFVKKEAEYRKELQRKSETIVQMNAIQTELVWNNQKLQDENAQLKDWIERLLQYTELSEADIKKVCEQDKRRGEAMTNFMGLFDTMGKYLNY